MPPHIDLEANGSRLDVKTPLWRYMKLSTLIYMLTGKRAFIPKLGKLQHDDKFEGKIDLIDGQPEKFRRDQSLEAHESWLRRTRAEGGTTEAWETPPPILSELWLRELARRRCVWCWHQSEHECMAQWRIYGKDAGVVIRSDAESVLEVFHSADVVYGNVQYMHPGELPHIPPSLLLPWHPYFLKHGSFQHEREVRFVLADDPDFKAGRPITVDPSTLIKAIVVSPFLFESEATAVLKAIKQLSASYGITDVRISGAQDESHPHGRTDSTIEERFLEFAADQWLAGMHSSKVDHPSILKLISPAS